MKRMLLLGSVAAMAWTIGAGAPALAQGAQQSIAMVTVDVQKLATGYRSSKIVGSPVVNEAGERIGKIDDLLITRDDRVPFAVLSVGGFLGMGNHLIAVPYNRLQIADDRMVLPGATKDVLKAMPEFKYASR